MCDARVEGFKGKAAADYAAWARQHPEMVQSQPTMGPSEGPKPSSGAEMAQLSGYCELILDEIRPPDPRIATPQQTWDLFVKALRTDDKSALADCFEGSARAEYVGLFQNLSSAELVRVAESFTSFKMTVVAQQAVVKRSDGKSGFVLFTKSGSGWRISSL